MGYQHRLIGPVADGETARPVRVSTGHRLRTIVAAAVFGLAGLGGFGGGVLADDSTDSMPAAPPAGMSVQVAEDTGVAQLTVYGMADTGIAAQGDDGSARYVLVDLDVRNAGDAPFVFNSRRVQLHDETGTVYTRVKLDDDRPADLSNFRQLRGQELNSDDRARGWLAFAVDDDSTLQAVSYRGDDGDDVGVADLTVAAITHDDDDDRNDDGIADDDGSRGGVARSGDDDDDGGFDDDGGGAVAGGDDDDGYYGDDDGYYGDDGGAAPAPAPAAPAPAPAPATGGGYYGGDDDGWDDDGGGYYGGDDDGWDDDGGGDDDGGDDD